MAFKLTPTNRAIIAAVVVVALGIAFWMLALGPKRDEAKKLGAQVEKAESSLAKHQAEVSEALEARSEFSADYRQLVVLGKAVPGDDDTASLLVQLNRISNRTGNRFTDFALNSQAAAEPAPELPAEAGTEATAAANPVSPTEAAAATMPIGAKVGAAGLGVMPYTLSFEGDFFKIADFIGGLDSLVKTKNEELSVDGRLITVDGFALKASENKFPQLKGLFAVSTYLTPPSQGVTGGATPTAPAATTATPASTTIGATP